MATNTKETRTKEGDAAAIIQRVPLVAVIFEQRDTLLPAYTLLVPATMRMTRFFKRECWAGELLPGNVVMLTVGSPTTARSLITIAATVKTVEWLSQARPLPDYTSSNGDMPCPVCGRKCFDHPYDLRYLSYDGTPYLILLCDGDIVKL